MAPNLTVLEDRGVIAVTGADAATLLDGLVTNSLARLGDGGAIGIFPEGTSAEERRVHEAYAAEVRARVLETRRDMAHDLTFIRHTVLTEMASAAGYTDFLIEEAFAVFDDARNEVELFPEARPALRALRERYTVIAVTNGNAKLDKIGIDDLFDGHINAAAAGAAKPERQIFDAAVEAGGASANETLHVGDHPLYDIQGARDAGLRTVWVNRNSDSWPSEFAAPDIEVRHVGELHELLP